MIGTTTITIMTIGTITTITGTIDIGMSTSTDFGMVILGIGATGIIPMSLSR